MEASQGRKWVSNAGRVRIFCPVNVLAVAVKDDKVYHYTAHEIMRAYEKLWIPGGDTLAGI